VCVLNISVYKKLNTGLIIVNSHKKSKEKEKKCVSYQDTRSPNLSVDTLISNFTNNETKWYLHFFIVESIYNYDIFGLDICDFFE